MSKKSVKTHIFGIISYIPLAILLIFALLIGKDCYFLRHLDGDQMERRAKELLALRDHLSRVAFRVPYEKKAVDDRTVYVFGESSVVITDGGTFTDYLGKSLRNIGYSVRMSNEGLPGRDSLEIEMHVNDILRNSNGKPALFVFYLGHNDYNSYYHHPGIFSQLPGVNALLRTTYFLTAQKYRNLYSKKNDRDNYSYYTRTWAPGIINIMQEARLTSVNTAAFNGVNRAIRENFRKNMEKNIENARRDGVPVVLCTLVGNLHARPYGNYADVTEVYRRGIKTGDYHKRIELLRRAKDNELFTYDMRAKSDLNDDIRSMAGKGVYVLDLERILNDRHFSFSDDDFLDYFHMKDRTHKMIGELLAEFINRKRLIGKDNQNSDNDKEDGLLIGGRARERPNSSQVIAILTLSCKNQLSYGQFCIIA